MLEEEGKGIKPLSRNFATLDMNHDPGIHFYCTSSGTKDLWKVITENMTSMLALQSFKS